MSGHEAGSHARLGRHRTRFRRLPVWQKATVVVGALGILAAVVVVPTAIDAQADIVPQRQTVQGPDGKDYWVENHVDPEALEASEQAAAGVGTRPEYLIVWAGDENAADTAVGTVKNLPGSLANPLDTVRNAAPGPDFMAVVDATKGSPRYGEVVNTATVGPLVENEPHHMQYTWSKGNKIFAGGLYTAATYVFDVTHLPNLSLSGISLPSQTKCGSVPDAYWVNDDGTAYGTYMGGPVAPGPCRYTNGEVREGNGFGGSPGEIVKFDQNGGVISESPAATVAAEDPEQCLNLPQLSKPTCANPHGIQVREDLDTIVTSDYAEPRTIILDPVKAPSPQLRRTTVRTWDISDPDHPKIRSVKYLPVGPRSGPEDPLRNENRAVMETTVTKRPENKGAFAMTMQGGAIFYTPDMTSDDPEWTEVYDLDAAVKQIDPNADTGAGLNGGWLEVAPDDKTLYHAVMGRQPGALGPDDPGTAGGVIALDITELLAAGTEVSCSVETPEQQRDPGGTCPTLKSTLPINPGATAGGPHWGALDNLELADDGFYRETDDVRRLSTANYFVARTGLDGDHRVCMVDIDGEGQMSLDEEFRDEFTDEPCVDFNRASWPHGEFGNAKPHSQLFVTADRDIK